MAYAFVGIGLLLLFAGSEALLRAGIGISRTVGISPTIVGLFIVSAAASAPEFSVAVQAMARHAPELAVANVVGSNLVNLLLILGLGALFTPLPSPPKNVFRDGLAMVLASGVLVFAAWDGRLSRLEGYGLLAGLVVYVAASIVIDWRKPAQDSEARAQCRGAPESFGMSVFLVGVGLVTLYFGGRCLIDGALAVAQQEHLSATIVALILVALATAVPEFVFMVSMAVRRWSDVTLGYLFSSSIFNILGVLGFTAVVYPHGIPLTTNYDLFIMLGVAVILMPLMISSWRLSRFNGVLLLLGYIAYAAFLAWRLGYLPISALHG
ncbi:MAG TPA: calcium/sodium antiporter [Rhizomicrobium sp.]|jgi:cation:H+ antiporter